mgnify:CR=1 FL=1
MLADCATPSFTKVAKKKRGNSSGMFFHQFKLNNQETLLAYELRPHKNAPTEAMLLAVGPHENFYAALKR